MKYHRKLSLIKLYSQRIRNLKVASLLHSQDQQYASYFLNGNAPRPPPEDQEEEGVGEAGVELDDDNFDIADYINSMPVKLRKEFKLSNPQLPQLFFMTQKEKKQYFEKMNNKFKRELTHSPQRKSRNKKKIIFKNEFDIRGFNENQKVAVVSKAKDIHQSYQQQIHFS